MKLGGRDALESPVSTLKLEPILEIPDVARIGSRGRTSLGAEEVSYDVR